jgi:hypothetical protein
VIQKHHALCLALTNIVQLGLSQQARHPHYSCLTNKRWSGILVQCCDSSAAGQICMENIVRPEVTL